MRAIRIGYIVTGAIATLLILAVSVLMRENRGLERRARKWDRHCSSVRAGFSADEFGLRQTSDLKYRRFVLDHFLNDESLPYHGRLDALDCGVPQLLFAPELVVECRARRDYDCLVSVAHHIVDSIPQAE